MEPYVFKKISPTIKRVRLVEIGPPEKRIKQRDEDKKYIL